MIDLTPLDVRNKRGDFKKIMRGYDPQEVDVFLEIAAERLEALVRENLKFRERTHLLQEQVSAQTGREQAVQDALVTAQELRTDIRTQSQREAEHLVREADAEAGRLIAEAEAEVRGKMRGVERQLEQAQDSLGEMERRRTRFLKEFRGLLGRELDVVDVEEGRVPLEERPIDLDLGRSRNAAQGDEVESAPVAEESEDGDVDVTEGAAPPAAAGEGHVPDAEAIDVSELQPSSPAAPPPDVPAEPMSLEVELMADAEGKADARRGRLPVSSPAAEHFAGVPDLETVLAEAAGDENDPPAGDDEEVAPPAIKDRRDDVLILFDPEDEDSRR